MYTNTTKGVFKRDFFLPDSKIVHDMVYFCVSRPVWHRDCDL